MEVFSRSQNQFGSGVGVEHGFEAERMTLALGGLVDSESGPQPRFEAVASAAGLDEDTRMVGAADGPLLRHLHLDLSTCTQ